MYYMSLDNITKVYEYPISRCDMIIIIFWMDSFSMWMVTVNDEQEYHKVKVRRSDIETLICLDQTINYTSSQLYHLDL